MATVDEILYRKGSSVSSVRSENYWNTVGRRCGVCPNMEGWSFFPRSGLVQQV